MAIWRRTLWLSALILVLVAVLTVTRQGPDQIDGSVAAQRAADGKDSPLAQSPVSASFAAVPPARFDSDKGSTSASGCEDDREFDRWWPFDGPEPVTAQEYDEFLSADVADVAAILGVSDEVDHRLAAALLTTGYSDEARLKTLQEILAAEPDHKLAYWDLLDTCRYFLESPICHAETVTGLALRIDPQNSLVWSKIAALEHLRVDSESALTMLRRAAVAADSNYYWADHVRLVERALAAGGKYNYHQRLVVAMGVLARGPMLFDSLYDACKTGAVDSPEWRDVCFAYGQRLENDNQTLIGKMMGLAFQLAIAKISGDTNSLEAISNRRGQAKEVNESFSDLNFLRPDILAGYVDRLATHGELEAMRFAMEEADRLKSFLASDECRD